MRSKKKLEFAGVVDGYEFARDKVDDLYVSVGFNNTCKTHFHKQIELFYIISGKVKVNLNKDNFVMSRGDLLVCNPFDIHDFTQDKPALSCVVSIPTRFLHHFEKCTLNTRFNGNYIKRCSVSKQIFKLMKSLMSNQKEGDLISLGFSMLIFGKVASKLGLSKVNQHESSLIFKIVEYIDENYKEQISLESLANHCGYSKNYISKEFNASFNCNLNEYINLKRLQAFIALHEANKDNIINNALTVGFNSARTFYNAFSEHFKMTPKEYFATEKKHK